MLMTINIKFLISLWKLDMLRMQKLEYKFLQYRITWILTPIFRAIWTFLWDDGTLIWKLCFNVAKWKVLALARCIEHNFQYHLNNITLEYVKQLNDLGCLTNSSLICWKHIYKSISKVNRRLGLIKRTVGFNAPYQVKLYLYITLDNSAAEKQNNTYFKSL